MKLACQLNIEQAQTTELIDGKKPVKLHARGKHELNNECVKVMLTPPGGTKPRTPRQLRRDSIWPGRVFSVTFAWLPATHKMDATHNAHCLEQRK